MGLTVAQVKYLTCVKTYFQSLYFGELECAWSLVKQKLFCFNPNTALQVDMCWIQNLQPETKGK